MPDQLMTATEVDLAVVPRDGLQFRDGRHWGASAGGRSHTLDWPYPSSLLGALRTAYGRQLEMAEGIRLDSRSWPERTRDVELRIPLALRRPLGESWSPAHRMWPRPADAIYIQDDAEPKGSLKGSGSPSGRLVRLEPHPGKNPTLGTDDDPAREALWRPILEQRGKPLPAPPWWPDAAAIAWLAGKPVDAELTRIGGMASRLQVSVSLDEATLAYKEGALFASTLLETLERAPSGRPLDRPVEWAIGLRAALPGDGRAILGAPFTLGGDGRLAIPEELPAEVFSLPRELEAAFASGPRGLRLLVVSPGHFDGGWLPDGLSPRGAEYRGQLAGIPDEVILKAAFMDRPRHVSGWDLARHEPKPTRRLVAPGSVFFFTKADGRPFTPEDARNLWFRRIGSDTHEGFGVVVPGVWNPPAE